MTDIEPALVILGLGWVVAGSLRALGRLLGLIAARI
ncbi:MAG: hypothetical protein JWQ16_1749 [Novosphingobium sp.]|nr:hypothetical protein [Novosphingobium sp.]